MCVKAVIFASSDQLHFRTFCFSGEFVDEPELLKKLLSLTNEILILIVKIFLYESRSTSQGLVLFFGLRPVS
jgi:hypothetical protein